MTAEEAISILQKHTQYFIPAEDSGAFAIAIEALEKQIPKSPERYIQPGVCVCPNCHGIIEAHTSKTFCAYCGQSITYSESDDSTDE